LGERLDALSRLADSLAYKNNAMQQFNCP
jgi:hypothetical protein